MGSSKKEVFVLQREWRSEFISYSVVGVFDDPRNLLYFIDGRKGTYYVLVCPLNGTSIEQLTIHDLASRYGLNRVETQ